MMHSAQEGIIKTDGITIGIVEDHDLVRLSVRLSLEKNGQFKVVGEAKTGVEGIRMATECSAEVILMDLGLPELDGIEATRRIKDTTSKKIIVLTSQSDDDAVIAALRAGADGFLRKDTTMDDMVVAVYSVAHGASWLEESIATRILAKLCPKQNPSQYQHQLSKEEFNLVGLLNAGYSFTEAAKSIRLPLSRVHESVLSILKRIAQKGDRNKLLETVSDCQLEPATICTRCRMKVENADFCPEDGGRLFADPLIGHQVSNRYIILSLIGTGGNGAVYKAKHLFTEKLVAIKVLHSDLAQSAELLNRFRQEAVAIASLEHPNIVSVSDFGIESNGTAYMVMDYLEGVSLVSLLKTHGPLDYRTAIPIFLEVCQGVGRAHEAGIIHRDLKPGNIHISIDKSRGSQVKVLDFGLAKVTGQKCIVMTVPGEIFGSPAFMSPEQCNGQKLDMRSDIYAMGCLMFQALTGSVVFVGNSAPEVMYHQIYSQPRRVSEVADVEVPHLLEMVILKCLNKNPDDRYQSMFELSSALSNCVF